MHHSKEPQTASTSSDQDRTLVKRALAGDQAAYAVLVQKYSNGLRHHIKATVRSEPNAGDQVLDDLVQESFIKAFNALGSYSTHYAFSTWLYRIATNHAIDFLRKRRIKTISLERPVRSGERTRPQDVPDDTMRPDKRIISQQRQQLIEQAICTLPDKFRNVIKLRHQQEKSYKEIADELELPLGTVKAHLHRARKRLYIALREKRDIL